MKKFKISNKGTDLQGITNKDVIVRESEKLVIKVEQDKSRETYIETIMKSRGTSVVKTSYLFSERGDLEYQIDLHVCRGLKSPEDKNYQEYVSKLKQAGMW